MKIKKHRIKKFPKVSFIIATYFGERTLRDCLTRIFNQNYQKNKIEVIIVDGGSKDKTLEIAKEFPVKIIHNPYKWNDGVGMGKSQGGKKATGDFIAFVDQDNLILGKNWIRDMIKPFYKDKTVSIVGSKLAVVKPDSFVNQYLSLVGTDPFACYKSLEGQLELNEKEFEKDGDYLVYDMSRKKPICAGSNGYVYKREYYKKIGGYTRDNENIVKLAKLKTKIFVSLKARLHHKTVTSLFGLLKKRWFWMRYYLTPQKTEERKFEWLPQDKKGKLDFIKIVALNLLILPNFFISIKKYLQSREKAWFLHSPLVFLVTCIYILSMFAMPKGRKMIFSWFKK